jgi:hypothetical protein
MIGLALKNYNIVQYWNLSAEVDVMTSKVSLEYFIYSKVNRRW